MDTPEIILVEEALKPRNTKALVVVRGYLSEGDGFEKYRIFARKFGWKGSIYGIVWDAGEIGLNVRNALTAFNAIFPVSGPKLFTELLKILAHWNKIKQHAGNTGENYMFPLLKQLKESEISFITHSLGARVCFYGLHSLIGKGLNIKECIFMGGAISGEKEEWSKIASELNCKVLNIYNEWDWILLSFYRAGNFTLRNPCGLKPIKEIHPNIVNISVTDYVDNNPRNHFVYIEVLDKTIITDIWSEDPF